MKQFFLGMMFVLSGCVWYVHGAADSSFDRQNVLQQIVADRYPSFDAIVRLHDIFRTAENYFWYVKDPLFLDQIKNELSLLVQGGHLSSELMPYAQDLLNLMNKLPVDDLVVQDQIADEFQRLLDDYSKKEDEAWKNVHSNMIVGIEKEKINKAPKEWIVEVIEALNASGLGRSFVDASSNEGIVINDEVRGAFQALFADAVQAANLSQDQDALIRHLLNAVSNPEGSFDWGSYYQEFKRLFMSVQEQLAEEKVFVKENEQAEAEEAARVKAQAEAQQRAAEEAKQKAQMAKPASLGDILRGRQASPQGSSVQVPSARPAASPVAQPRVQAAAVPQPMPAQSAGQPIGLGSILRARQTQRR